MGRLWRVVRAGTRIVRSTGRHEPGTEPPFGRLDRRDWWLGVSLAVGLVAVAGYLATNPYPAYGAGLYVQIAEEIAATGRLPARVPGYTAEGVPFAYPPLQLLVVAGLLEAGGDPVTIARFLPPIGVLAGLVPTYLIGRTLSGSRPGGAAAAVVVASTPQLLQWHLSAGGVVRAFAFCWAACGIYAGLSLFPDGSRRATAAATLAVAATLLSHPTYALFTVVTLLLAWLTRDRSAAGLRRGAAVAAGSGLLVAPWLWWVAATHGLDVLAAAAGTHGGVGGGVAFDPSVTWLVPVGGLLVWLTRGGSFPFAWGTAAELLFAQPRFALAVGAVVAATLAVGAVRWVEQRDPGAFHSKRRAIGVAALAVTGGVGVGRFAARASGPTDPDTPAFLDAATLDAMEWIREATPRDATFVVVGDAAEWVPALTDRTILVGPWGVEWRGSAAYARQLAAFRAVGRCETVECLLARSPEPPEYVSLPIGRYTVRGERRSADGSLRAAFDRADGWRRAFRNDGVVIYRRCETRSS